MKKYSGFTLIELLVVVLIIGILAAIALPQYQKVVRKARFAEVKTTSRALMNAIDNYNLANGFSFTHDVGELDIELPMSYEHTSTWEEAGWYYNDRVMYGILCFDGSPTRCEVNITQNDTGQKSPLEDWDTGIDIVLRKTPTHSWYVYSIEAWDDNYPYTKETTALWCQFIKDGAFHQLVPTSGANAGKPRLWQECAAAGVPLI